MRRNIFAIIILFNLGACTEKNKEPVLNYNESTITAVLIDLYVVAEIIDDVHPDKQDSLRKIYIQQIEKIHDVDFHKVESDIELIQGEPKRYQEIHVAAKDSLAKMEKTIKSPRVSKSRS